MVSSLTANSWANIGTLSFDPDVTDGQRRRRIADTAQARVAFRAVVVDGPQGFAGMRLGRAGGRVEAWFAHGVRSKQQLRIRDASCVLPQQIDATHPLRQSSRTAAPSSPPSDVRQFQYKARLVLRADGHLRAIVPTRLTHHISV
jgi:hypothetical protein